MANKYSRTEFKGYTHRFIVSFEIGEPYKHSVHLYSNSDSYEDLEKFVNDKKSKKVISFEIIHRASKEEDESSTRFIEEVMIGI